MRFRECRSVSMAISFAITSDIWFQSRTGFSFALILNDPFAINLDYIGCPKGAFRKLYI